MKKIYSSLAFTAIFICSVQLFAQSDATVPTVKPVSMDTLVTVKNEKIPCKVFKISDYEIEYKKSTEADAPIFTTSRDKIREIRWANGKKELLFADEMDVNQEKQILDKRSAIKFHIFSPVASQVTFSYEHCLKVGTNIEVSAGLINNSILYNSSTNLVQGGLFSAGVKFLLGQDFYINGLKYAHPLKGRYIKPEIDFSSFVMRGGTVTSYYGGTSSIPDEHVSSLALMINYGRQFVLGNILTFGYSIGLGYAISDSDYTSPNINSPNYSYSNGNPKNIPNDLYSHFLFSATSPIAVKGTISMGYIFK
jgi:hypothetical protein